MDNLLQHKHNTVSFLACKMVPRVSSSYNQMTFKNSVKIACVKKEELGGGRTDQQLKAAERPAPCLFLTQC